MSEDAGRQALTEKIARLQAEIDESSRYIVVFKVLGGMIRDYDAAFQKLCAWTRDMPDCTGLDCKRCPGCEICEGLRESQRYFEGKKA
uniref:Uncharacterized protein n=1 Tax=marine sediment metagenome TaxID=412755 RepID=A0A0F9F3Z7_9ZZZZ